MGRTYWTGRTDNDYGTERLTSLAGQIIITAPADYNHGRAGEIANLQLTRKPNRSQSFAGQIIFTVNFFHDTTCQPNYTTRCVWLSQLYTIHRVDLSTELAKYNATTDTNIFMTMPRPFDGKLVSFIE